MILIKHTRSLWVGFVLGIILIILGVGHFIRITPQDQLWLGIVILSWTAFSFLARRVPFFQKRWVTFLVFVPFIILVELVHKLVMS